MVKTILVVIIAAAYLVSRWMYIHYDEVTVLDKCLAVIMDITLFVGIFGLALECYRVLL